MSTVSEALSGQEFVSTIDDTDMVADALVVMRLVDKETGSTTVLLTRTVQSDIVTVLGLGEAMRQQLDQGAWYSVEEDDDEL